MGRRKNRIGNATIPSAGIAKKKNEPIDPFEGFSLRELSEELGAYFTSCLINNRKNFLEAMIDSDSDQNID